MFERTELGKDIANSRDALLNAIVQSRDRAALGKTNAEKMTRLNNEEKYYMEKSLALRETINYIVKEYKNIEQYLINKKELSMEMLGLAVEKAGLIVPDADIKGIHLSVKEKTARVVNDKGQDINLREGSAFRTVMGILMKYTLIKFQQDCLQIIFLDEAFSTLSDTTSAVMRDFIEALKQDILIVGIEQRNLVYDGIDRVTYQVIKGEDSISTIRRVEA